MPPMSRRCKIDDNANLKTWSKVIHVMTSLGDGEIHFSFTDATLTLTVFDASLAVSVTCTFFSSFFQVFQFPPDYAKTFSVSTKCILKPFRSMRFLTKSCTTCEMRFEDDADQMTISMECKSGAEIRYTIHVTEEQDEMHTNYDPETLKNWISTEPKTLISCLQNFAHSKGLIDLTLKAEGSRILLKNCANDLMRKEGKVYTELCLSALEFDRINIEMDTEVTFQMKDFKAFVSLAEHMKLPIGVHFQGVRDPVILTIKSEHFDATLLMATKVVADIIEVSTAGNSQSSSAASNRISSISSHESQRAKTTTTNASSRNAVRDDMSTAASFDFPEEGRGAVPTPTPPPTAERPRLSVSRHRPGGNVINNPEQENVNASVNASAYAFSIVNEVENPPPPRKRLRDLFPHHQDKVDLNKKFPGHDHVLLDGSDEED